MDIETFPSMRILNVQNKIKRFKYIGDFESDIVEYFLKNYSEGDLRNYKLNQKFHKSKYLKSFRRINSYKLKKIKKDFEKNHLVYFYSRF